MDRVKPPGQWDDGVREPRVVLGTEPKRELLGPFKRRAVDVATVDQRAANQMFDAAAGEAEQPAPAPAFVSHPRVKNRRLEESPGHSDSEVSEP